MQPKLKNILIAIALLLFDQTVCGQSKTALLDSMFGSLYRHKQFNGNVLVAIKGKIVYQRSFGYADIRREMPNSPASEFSLASVSKVITSTAILQLKEKGRVKLDDPLVTYFPDFPFRTITIRNLLTHTSGLPDYELFEKDIKKDSLRIFYNKDIIPQLIKEKTTLRFKPGERWAYSNLNFCLLALLVEKVSNLQFEDYVSRYIFEPAGMKNSQFQIGSFHSGDKKWTVNYDYSNVWTNTLEDVEGLAQFRWRLLNANGFLGQGNIRTTSADMLKFDQALYGKRLLKAASLEEAFKPGILNNGKEIEIKMWYGNTSYGLGWFIFRDTSAGKVVYHTGGVPGAASIFLRNISKGETVVIFDNAFNGGIFKSGFNALDLLANKTVVPVRQPVSREYASVLVEHGRDLAFCRLNELRQDSTHYYLNEGDMNELGLRLLYQAKFAKHRELAAEVLKLNILLFPMSFNTYDSFGELLAYIGQKKEAVFMYKRSIELNPDNTEGRKILESLEKELKGEKK